MMDSASLLSSHYRSETQELNRLQTMLRFQDYNHCLCIWHLHSFFWQTLLSDVAFSAEISECAICDLSIISSILYQWSTWTNAVICEIWKGQHNTPLNYWVFSAHCNNDTSSHNTFHVFMPQILNYCLASMINWLHKVINTLEFQPIKIQNLYCPMQYFHGARVERWMLHLIF